MNLLKVAEGVHMCMTEGKQVADLPSQLPAALNARHWSGGAALPLAQSQVRFAEGVCKSTHRRKDRDPITGIDS